MAGLNAGLRAQGNEAFATHAGIRPYIGRDDGRSPPGDPRTLSHVHQSCRISPAAAGRQRGSPPDRHRPRLGLVDDLRLFNAKVEQVEQNVSACARPGIHPQHPSLEAVNALVNTPLTRGRAWKSCCVAPSDLRRPDGHRGCGACIDHAAAADQVEIRSNYAGYIERQHDGWRNNCVCENTLLPLDVNYRDVNGLSNEVIAKLNDAKPETIGQATRISGITPCRHLHLAGAPEETRPAA